MGCLIELLLEAFGEVFLEMYAEPIANLLYRVIKFYSPKVKRDSKTIRIISVIIAAPLMIMPIVGIFMIVQEKGAARIAGIIMAAVPCLLFVIGFVVSAVKEKRKNKNGEESSDEGDQS